MTAHTTTDVLIIGTGFSGLGMAIQLQRSGRDDFVIVEKADAIGGTWRDNTYPGIACDIPSLMYSFSYEQNPHWTRAYSSGREIWDYLEDVTDKYGLRDRIRFGVELSSARWDADEGVWHATAANGDTYTARILVSGIGALHIPRIPELPGLEDFKQNRPAFHTAQWDHGVDLTGKRVAVIGTGASAIQVIPQIAEQVGELRVFQRTAPWVMPRPDHPISPKMRDVFERMPGIQRAYRYAWYWFLESRAIGFNGHPKVQKVGERFVQKYMARKVADPELRKKLTPDYRMGCKRVLLASDYFPVYKRDNVHLVTGGVGRLTAKGVVDADGVEHEVDAVIFGTGFHVVDSFQYLDVTGADGQDLAKEFDEHGVETYLGINVAGFPNLFFLLGPNTGLGHNSVVFMIEQQAKYVVRLLDEMDRRRVRTVDVSKPAQDSFQRRIQDKLHNGIWTTGGCTSWYLDSKGVNRTIWPGFTFSYWWETLRVDTDAYEWGRAVPNRGRAGAGSAHEPQPVAT
ncbi:MAG TPA: NAD(P)/FAD-dependent oxidoreductase [Nocardioidaceae bacterium]|nr:NAD(P)/FAD-dependent oxidoreductase [Nocardioidaceae bacterium]